MNLPASISLFSNANDLAVELDLVIGHVVLDCTVLLHAAHIVTDSAHDARIKKVKDPGREWKLTEF